MNYFIVESIKALVQLAENQNTQSFKCKKIKESKKTYETDFFKKQLVVEKKHFWFKTRNLIILNELKKLEESNKDIKILEIGCGTGNVLSFLEKNGFKVEGADLYLEALKICRQKTESNLYQFDIRNIPFNKKWGIIGCFDVIEHLEEDILALKNIYKALKPKGTLILTVPAVKILYSKNEGTHKRRYSKKELREKLEKIGFKIEKISYFFSFLFPLIFALRLWRKIKKEKYIKDVDLNINPIINSLFLTICSLETMFLKRVNFSIGTSLLAVAQKS